MFRSLILSLAFMLSLAIAGCSSSDEGPTKYQLSGKVTFQGKPVPKGQITFAPDNASGNRGPGSGAPIVDGHFETPPGKGQIGGAHQVRVVGYDGVPTSMEGETLPDGTPLFPPYETVIDLPKEDGTYDIKVPAAGATE